MPIELQIIRASEFIRVGPQGHFDLESSKEVLKVLASACRKRGINQALLDLRELRPGPTPVFSPKDLATLVNTFQEFGFVPSQRLAVLYESDPHHRASLFAFIGRTRGWQVQAFAVFEEAITWLSASEPGQVDDDSNSPEAQVIPVRQQTSDPS